MSLKFRDFNVMNSQEVFGSETRRLRAGDCARIPPDVDHGAVCVEAGVLLDVFSPVRKDFLAES